MRHSPRFLYISALCAALLAEPVSVKAAKLIDQNVCILEHMGNTRSQAARTHISSACNFLSQHSASLVLNREQREFSRCVLKFLTGVESDGNAFELARSCRQLVWDGKAIP
ncbi:MAG: hypothetical protein GKS03_10535 [Alphaproteobacteria bacterium]|nr:hypothetical protein [Alphaproteobacteria bacterium]